MKTLNFDGSVMSYMSRKKMICSIGEYISLFSDLDFRPFVGQ